MQRWEIVKAIAESRGPLAVATIVGLRGSAPRHLGSKMVLFGDGAGASAGPGAGPSAGATAGSVGGGPIEGRALDEARECLAARRSSLVHVRMTGKEAVGPESICGGEVDIALEYLADPRLYAAAAAALARGEAAVLVSEPGVRGCIAVTDASGRLLSGGAGPEGAGPFMAGSLEAELAAAVSASGIPAFDSKSELFYEPIEAPERLLVLGGGHVGLAVARLASELGFLVCVADPRSEYSDPARFPPGVETRRGEFADIVAGFPFGKSTYAVVVSPGHVGDLECVRALLGREYRYAGFIGSRRKVAMIMDQLVAEGFDPEKVRALKAPIGADIGAETPAEIAVSILAEIIDVRRLSPAASAMDADRSRRRS
jgi:xanthine dehydrogenase accessory factor